MGRGANEEFVGWRWRRRASPGAWHAETPLASQRSKAAWW